MNQDRTLLADLALEFFDGAPVSMWACDKDYKIVLWNSGAEAIYGVKKIDAIGRNYLTLFVDAAERAQSKVDCDRVINEGWTQYNCLAYDSGPTGRRRHMLTNVFRICHPLTGDHLQAEIGVEISDLGLKNDEHRQLREVGVACLAKDADSFERERSALVQQIDRVSLETTLVYRGRRHELVQWAQRSVDAREIADTKLAELESLLACDQRIIEELRQQVGKCTTLQALENAKAEFKKQTEDGLSLYGSLQRNDK